MASINDVFRITTVAEYLGQQMLNVYFYKLLDVPASGNPLEGAASFVRDEILPAVAAIQHQLYSTKLIRVENMNSSEVFEEVVDIAGQVSASIGNPLPSFYALTFQLVRETRTTRHGSKRFGGIPDNIVLGNEYYGSMVPITTIANKLKQTWTVGLVDSFEPVIVKHPVLSPPYNPVTNRVMDVLFKGVRTQNTRKKSRGV